MAENLLGGIPFEHPNLHRNLLEFDQPGDLGQVRRPVRHSGNVGDEPVDHGDEPRAHSDQIDAGAGPPGDPHGLGQRRFRLA